MGSGVRLRYCLRIVEELKSKEAFDDKDEDYAIEEEIENIVEVVETYKTDSKFSREIVNCRRDRKNIANWTKLFLFECRSNNMTCRASILALRMVSRYFGIEVRNIPHPCFAARIFSQGFAKKLTDVTLALWLNKNTVYNLVIQFDTHSVRQHKIENVLLIINAETLEFIKLEPSLLGCKTHAEITRNILAKIEHLVGVPKFVAEELGDGKFIPVSARIVGATTDGHEAGICAIISEAFCMARLKAEEEGFSLIKVDKILDTLCTQHGLACTIFLTTKSGIFGYPPPPSFRFDQNGQQIRPESKILKYWENYRKHFQEYRERSKNFSNVPRFLKIKPFSQNCSRVPFYESFQFYFKPFPESIQFLHIFVAQQVMMRMITHILKIEVLDLKK